MIEDTISETSSVQNTEMCRMIKDDKQYIMELRHSVFPESPSERFSLELGVRNLFFIVVRIFAIHSREFQSQSSESFQNLLSVLAAD